MHCKEIYENRISNNQNILQFMKTENVFLISPMERAARQQVPFRTLTSNLISLKGVTMPHKQLSLKSWKTQQQIVVIEEVVQDLGFSFFSLKRARRDTPDTFTTLNLTRGYPQQATACPFRPNPPINTSSCIHARPWGKPHKPKGQGNLPMGAIN